MIFFNKSKVKKKTFFISENIIFLLPFLFLVIYLVFTFAFIKYKDIQISQAKKENSLMINNLHLDLGKLLLNNDYEQIDTLLDKNINNHKFSRIEVVYKKFIFNKRSILTDENYYSWNLGDIVLDASLGYIAELPMSNFYEYIADDVTKYKHNIKVKIQVYNNYEIKYFFAPLAFHDIVKTSKNMISDETSSIFSKFINFENEIIKKELYANKNVSFGSVLYSTDTILLKNELSELFLLCNVILFTFLLLPFMFIFYYHKKVSRLFIKKPISYLNKYLNKLVNNEFNLIKKEKTIGIYGISDFADNISKLTTKIASLQNEVNINKKLTERKMSIDTLTGLYNESMFNFDMKNMLINNKNGFLLSLRIECLSSISKKYDFDFVNNFVTVYVGLIKNILREYAKDDITFYRLFGSSFSLLIKNSSLKNVEIISNKIINILETNIPSMFNTNENIVTIGGSYFDSFGTIASTLKSSTSSLSKACELGINKFYITKKEDIDKITKSLELDVISIINKKDFEVSFGFPTYLINNKEEIIMKELVPLLKNKEQKISIGPFISMASSLKKVHLFDTIVLQRAISYIKENDINYSIIVNISFPSLEYPEFLQYLGDLLKKESKIAKQIIFTVTSYSAYMNKGLLRMFIEDIHTYGSKILIKRYQFLDYPIHELKDLNIDYIRLHQNTSINISNDNTKKQLLRNFMATSELSNIHIIADSVYLESDYKILNILGAYAVCE